ncbi:hypothetical protein E1283_03895 [Streptomyces hainanensis]|uniref:Novel STAND NTPase 1 domain-containing protein n=2 Tax=Streptomyces hainanensis TaxID=402648 RepID=A0A4V6PBW9_9ACTN|nr:hypothetical protein E1283_03895 [Streptomyces hainanensis]
MRDGDDEQPRVRQWAEAADGASIFQAARDLHVVYVADVRAARRAAAAPPHAGECPYPGLASFDEADARWFHGRDALTAEILVGLDAGLSVAPPGPLIVVAPSGAGKSSLLRAGVLPALARAAPDRPRAVVRTPGARPLDATLEPGAALVVDQLEELFTLCEDEAERVAFLDRLQEHARRAPVICALRSDFYARAADYAVLRTALATRQVVVGPLTDDGLREAITRPAAEVGLSVEPGLVELLVDELGPAEAGRLPLLAHALRATWLQREGSVLTVDGYRATGGIRRAVATTAETTYAALDSDDTRAAARVLFLRLTRIGADGTDDTRRPLPATDLDPAALDAFTAARLLTRDDDTVTITHEALLRAWPRLREWIDADRADRLVRQRLEESATDWDRAGRDPDLLWAGNRLAAAESSPVDRLSPLATAFRAAARGRARRAAGIRRGFTTLVAVLAVLALGAAFLANRQADTARTERDTARFRQVAAVTDQLRDTDSSLAAQFNLVAHRMRSEDEAVRLDLVNDAGATLSVPVPETEAGVHGVFSARGGDVLVTRRGDMTVGLWDIRNPEDPRPLPDPVSEPVYEVMLGADGSTLATADWDGTVRLWRIGHDATVRPFGEPISASANTPVALRIDPTGTVMATSEQEGALRFWDIRDPDRVEPIGEPLDAGRLPSLGAFAPDGDLVVTTSGGAMTLWNTRDATRRTVFEAPEIDYWAPVFTPDGTALAANSGDDTLWFWNIADPGRPRAIGNPLVTGQGRTSGITFGPDGRTLATNGEDGTVRLWRLDRPTAEPTPLGGALAGHTGSVVTIAFSADGSILAAGGEDGRTVALTGELGTVSLWDISDPGHPVQASGSLSDGVEFERRPTFSPAGDTLVYEGNDGALLLDLTDPRHPVPFDDRPLATDTYAFFDSFAFSPDGETLAALDSAARDSQGGILLWDVRDPTAPVPLGDPLPAATTGAMAFSPDGGLLAFGSEGDGEIQLWDTTSRERPRAVGNPSNPDAESGFTGILSLEFSPDGDTLFGSGEAGRILLWDVSDPAEPALLGDPLAGGTGTVRGSVWGMALSPDGRTLASVGGSTVRLWDVTDPTRPRRLVVELTGHTDVIDSVAFTPDGGTLVTASRDGTVRLWALDPDRAAERICAATRGVLTPEVWERHLPDQPYRPPCEAR